MSRVTFLQMSKMKEVYYCQIFTVTRQHKPRVIIVHNHHRLRGFGHSPGAHLGSGAEGEGETRGVGPAAGDRCK